MDSGQVLVAGARCHFDEEQHRYTIDGRYVPSVTKLLEVGGYVNKEVFKRYPNAAVRGKAIHMACELLDKGDLDWTSITDEGLPYVMAYENFLRESGFEAEHNWTERQLFNEQGMFAGTLDRRGKFPSSPYRAIIDLKTGSVPDCTSLQTMGYVCLMPVADGPFERYALRLGNDGSYKLIKYEHPVKDRRLFYGLVEHYWEKVEQGIINDSGELKWKVI